MADQKRFDLVIFGASGFTGKHVVEEVARTATKENITWAVAGRSESKLQAVLKEAAKNTAEELDNVVILIADVSKLESIVDMCSQTKVLLNCVGPYRFYGNVVVQTSIELGCHYVDISGETEWLEKIYMHCNEQATKKQLYIVQACGFDSIPADLGVIFTKQSFQGQLDYVESYFETKTGPHGSRINDGTWKSLVHSLSTKSNLRSVRTTIYPQPLPAHRTLAPRRRAVFHSDVVNALCVPFAGSDKAIVQRTNYCNYVDHKTQPVDYKPYLVIRGWLSLIRLSLIGFILFTFTKFSAGVKLLLKYPSVMSLGLFSSQGPSKRQVQTTTFETTFIGTGSSSSPPPSSSSSSPLTQKAKEPKKIKTKIVGPEPGYVTTPLCMVQSAYVILKEQEDMPNYGVLTPGRAFEKTSLIKRLQSRNLSFDVVAE